MSSRRVWTEQEDKAIQQLVNRYGHKNWANIANLLTEQFGTPQRSGKQCRERWHNHLNPIIEKKVWSKQEEERMFALHKAYGNKWTVISEALPGRTDNAIKNYFYSTIRRSLRRIGKFVGSKNSTEQMKHIKPSTLSKIFQASSQLPPQTSATQKQLELLGYIKDNCETVRASIIKFTNYKPRRNDKAAEAERAQLAEVINQMVYINEIYEKIKGEEKRRRYEELTFQKDNGKLRLSEDSFEEESDSEEQIENDYGELSQEVSPKKTKRTENGLQSIIQQQITKKKSQNNKNDLVTPATDSKSVESNNHYTIPTVIIKGQNLPGSDSEYLPENNNLSHLMDNPQYFVELKDEDMPCFQAHKRSGFLSHSPGFYFNTPANIPFNFFQSPSTPNSMDNQLSGLGIIQNNAVEDCKALIQKEIESNLRGEGKLSMSSSTMLGSPGSAFSFYAFPDEHI